MILNRRTKPAFKFSALAIIMISAAGCLGTAPKSPDITFSDLPVTNSPAKSGWEYVEAGSYEAAVPAFQLSLSKEPDNHRDRYGYAESLRYTGHADLAEGQYAKLLTVPEYRAQALAGVGLAKLATQDANGAFEMLNAAVAEDDTSWKAWLGLAQLNDIGRDWEAADTAYANALAHTNDRARVLNNHGVSMLARGDANAALTYFDQAAAIDPQSEHTKVNIDLANAVIGGDTDASHYEYLTAKERAQKFNNWGYSAMLRGDLTVAETYFEQAIEAHPSFYAIAHKNLQTLRSVRTQVQ